MNRNLKGFVVLVLSGLTACGSQPARDHYYSLVLAADDVAPAVAVERTTARVIVGPIHLSRYLNQPGLPMQIGANQIQTASHHFWAEPLDEAIGKVLVRDISRRVDGVSVDRDVGRWTPAGDCQLRVEFDKFHATQDSQVVVSGRYWLHERDGARVTKREFDIVQTLSADGYPHAVHQLRTALEMLAVEIVEGMTASAACLPDTRSVAG